MSAFTVQTERKKVRVVLYRRKTSAPFYCRWSWAGEDYHRSTGQQTESAARGSARRLVEECVREKPSGVDLTALKDAYLLSRWPTEKEQKNNLSYSAAKSRLKGFVEHAPADFAGRSRRDASLVIQAYLTTRSGKAALTVRSEQLSISRFCAWLNKTGRAHWESNPADAGYLEMPPITWTTKDVLPEKDVQAVLAATKNTPLRAVVLWCLGAGARPKEAARASWQDIDWESGMLKLLGKGRQRRVPLSDWLTKELKPLASKGPIWTHNYFVIFDQMAAIRKKKKLGAHVSLQAMRRTACRRAAEKMSVFVYSEYFGHSLEVAKRHYIGWGLNIDQQAVSQALDYSISDKKSDKPSR